MLNRNSMYTYKIVYLFDCVFDSLGDCQTSMVQFRSNKELLKNNIIEPINYAPFQTKKEGDNFSLVIGSMAYEQAEGQEYSSLIIPNYTSPPPFPTISSI